MSQDPSQIFFVVLSGIILMLLMSGFIVVMVLFHRQQQLRNRQKMDQLQAEYEKTILGVEKEIQEQTLSYIGQELHDNLGQLLSLTKLNLHQADPENISESKKLINQAIKEVRSLSKTLNLDWAKAINLVEFIQNELHKIEKSGFCQTALHTHVESLDLGQDKKLVLIRIVQECLNNILKHAAPRLIEIRLEMEGDLLRLQVKDDGRGFDTQAASQGMGLHNLKSRMEAIGGTLEISSIVDIGTEIKLLLPLKAV